MREAVELLQGAQRIFATTHVDPDGDAIGSLLGFAWTLRRLGKSVTVSMQDAVPWRFENLPGADEIQTTRPTPDHDLLVSLDASDFGRVGRAIAPEDRVGRPLLMIDHHVTNDLFGTVNVLEPQAAATAEIVYFLSLALGISPDQPTATCLLTGVVTDTLGFRTSNTTPRTLEVAQALMQAGANLADIAQRAFNSNSYASLRLTADALAGMTLDQGILWTEVTRADLARAGAEEGDHGGIVGLLNSVREAQIAAVLREKEDGRIDVSLRSKPGINVATAAVALGGGGHPLAAGATLPAPLAAARERVLAELRKLLTSPG
jgi:phosphoesterase RecJ-like protein